MASKTKHLLEKATQTVRQPRLSRLAPEPTDKGYRVIGISVYPAQADWIEQVSSSLNVNKSLVVREAIAKLQEELRDKEPSELFQYFAERRRKRGK